MGKYDGPPRGSPARLALYAASRAAMRFPSSFSIVIIGSSQSIAGACAIALLAPLLSTGRRVPTVTGISRSVQSICCVCHQGWCLSGLRHECTHNHPMLGAPMIIRGMHEASSQYSVLCCSARRGGHSHTQGAKPGLRRICWPCQRGQCGNGDKVSRWHGGKHAWALFLRHGSKASHQ